MEPELLIISPDPALRELAIRESSEFPIRVHAFATARSAQRHVAASRTSREVSADPFAAILLVDVSTEDVERLREHRRGDFAGSRYYLMRGSSDHASPSRVSWASGDLAETYVARPDDGAAMRQLLEHMSAASPALQTPAEPVTGLDVLIGRSVAFRVALEKAMRAAADRDAAVLMCGEPGTGKRLFARAIHAESARAQKPLVEVDCRQIGAGGRDLAMLTLCEHSASRAAAVSHREKAGIDEGSLLLSHVDALERDDQVRLLAYLDAHKLWRIQQLCRPRRDLRIIATSARDLDRDARLGGFVAELHERLTAHRIDLPALRERPSDVLLLAEHFLNRWTREQGRPAMRLARPARERLLGHGWPGNVGELRQAMRTAFERAGDAWEVRAEHLDGLLASAQAAPRSGGVSRPQALRSPLRATETPRGAGDGYQAPGATTPAAPATMAAPRALGGPPNAPGQEPVSRHAFVGIEGHELTVQLPDEGISFEELEKAILVAALEKTAGNVVQAAKLLRMGRGSLRYRLEKYQLVEPKRRSSRGGARRPAGEELETGLRRAS